MGSAAQEAQQALHVALCQEALRALLEECETAYLQERRPILVLSGCESMYPTL